VSSARLDAALTPVLLAAEEPLKWEDITPGLVGLLVVVLLFGATYLLFRSMNTQLKRVDAHFDEEDAADAAAAAGAADAGSPSSETSAAEPSDDEDGTAPRTS
jgi:hypothetical protein